MKEKVFFGFQTLFDIRTAILQVEYVLRAQVPSEVFPYLGVCVSSLPLAVPDTKHCLNSII